MKISQLASFLLLPIASAKLVKLNDSNFASATQDKIVFVKFFAPWVRYIFHLEFIFLCHFHFKIYF